MSDEPVHRVQTILACGCFLTYVDERITGWWPCEYHDPEAPEPRTKAAAREEAT